MLKHVTIVCLALMLPACAQWKATARINPSTVAVYPGGEGKQGRATTARAGYAPGEMPCPLTSGLSDGKQGAINLDCFEFPEHAGQPELLPAYDLAAGYSPANPESKPQALLARNRLSAILQKHADDVCLLEKGRLVATESSANFALSFLTQAFSGAATIVTGVRASNILSGIATLASGTQDNVNATFYRNQLVQAINKSIDQERERIATQIIASRAKDLDAYTVDDMITLVNSYHQACSFEHGLQVLLDAALDGDGAASVLENRSRERAITELQAHIASLKGKIRATPTPANIEALLAQLAEAEAQLHGMRMARAQKLITDPNAGDTAETHAEESPPDEPTAKGNKKGGGK